MQKQAVLGSIALVFALNLPTRSIASEANGAREMYLQYCASCHGADGKGTGPVSRELKNKVPDLTVIAKNNNGFYPLDAVLATIDGRRMVDAHGDADMPVWGEKFRRETKDSRYPELTTLLKAKAIAEYIGTLQTK